MSVIGQKTQTGRDKKVIERKTRKESRTRREKQGNSRKRMTWNGRGVEIEEEQ